MPGNKPTRIGRNSPPTDKTELLLYTAEDGRIRVQVRLCDETIWLSINQMAELFGVDKSGISRHLKNIFESGELSRDSVVANFATTATDGKTYQVEHFNLDAIISVGYRVNSIQGTRFRIWATERIREYLVKGFTLDDERLKEPEGGRYFEELLTHAGGISHDAAITRAHAEYEKFRERQLAEPSEVERHFIEAEKQLQQIESSRKGRQK
jgi:hypothetical protein